MGQFNTTQTDPINAFCTTKRNEKRNRQRSEQKKINEFSAVTVHGDLFLATTIVFIAIDRTRIDPHQLHRIAIHNSFSVLKHRTLQNKTEHTQNRTNQSERNRIAAHFRWESSNALNKSECRLTLAQNAAYFLFCFCSRILFAN